MKNFTRPATTFVTVVLAVSALVGTSSAAIPNLASRHMLARSPSSLLDNTAGRRLLLAIDSAGDAMQQEAVRARVLS
jgi:hypothetical protein